MAKHNVIDFSLTRDITENGVECLLIDIKTEIPKKFKYHLFTDVRQPTIEFMEKNLMAGLTEAKIYNKRIDISEYLERLYVFIDLPGIDKLYNQYTARKVY
ncbi:hypothetical protein P7L95_09090 [Bisgaard Taxon 10/6]|uniref:hypothetical protein n=1 Tax=Exercitatus varius TaxID=67857 RepID=UPI00294AD9BD|nr:hypothetical protein [Exercitatus varius]MDG2956901.1 hypothetical protein [Exercitatus varius]MDG2965034.1 hypothetical protein [Exercitatus varius]